MRTILIFIFLGGFSIGVTAQELWNWTDPAPLTDSISNNTNPFLLRMDLQFNPMKLMMVWEKSVDSTSTYLYLNNLLDTFPAELVIFEEGVHFSNPQLFYGPWYNSDTLFFIVYETNQNGNQDIYMIPYMNGGIIGNPAPFAASQEDEPQFSACFNGFWDKTKDNYMSSIAWVCSGNLYVRNYMIGTQGYYFSDMILIDSNYCSDPTINNQRGLIYTKQDSAGSKIKKSVCNYQGIWDEPQIIYEESDASNPTTALHLFTPCWSAKTDSLWTIMLGSSNNTYNISSEEPLDPAAVGMISTEGSPQSYISVCFPDNGNDEILMTPSPHSLDFENFSNSGTMNQNPQFFKGESEAFYYHWWDYLVWESYRNNHWQIWYSKNFNGYSSISENNNNKAKLTVYPNPLTTSTTIEYELTEPSHVQLSIYNAIGGVVYKAEERIMPQGKHSFTWTPERLPEGMYYAVLKSEEGISVVKLIKQ